MTYVWVIIKGIMEEKRRDLKSTQQKELLRQIMADLSKCHPSFYYLSTIEVAAEIKNYIDQNKGISRDDYLLLKGLTRRDIQIILSLH